MVIELHNKDFRDVKIPPGIRVLTVTDPPYNIDFKYDKYQDKLPEEEYRDMISKLKKPCVIICYPEEMIEYIIPALDYNPDKMLFWCYNAHLPRAVRMVAFFGIKPDLKRYKIPYKNPKDKRVKKLIENGSEGTAIKEWFVIEQVKNVSKEYQGYSNQIPEELINIILTVCEGQFDMVYDPFCGSGTTLKVALDKGYKIMGADIDKKAIEITKKRLIRLRDTR